jgi:hypothetical protein
LFINQINHKAMNIDIEGLSKAQVLAALYNRSKVQGLGYLQAKPGQMTEAQAQQELDKSSDKYFDYLHGKVMKISLATDEVRSDLYDRDNGAGACLHAIEYVRAQVNEVIHSGGSTHEGDE